MPGGGVILKFDVLPHCFAVFWTVCMQAMTHSVGNVQSQQAVKLVVVGPSFVEQCWFGLFLGDQWQWKMAWIGDMTLQSVTLTLKFSLIFQTNEENFTFITFKTDFYQMEARVFKDVSSSFFSNKWSHHDITAIVKDHLSVTQLLWFCKRPYYLSIFRFLSTL